MVGVVIFGAGPIVLWDRRERVIFGVMETESELFDICAQLQRDAGCKKVMVCGHEGEILAHTGERGILDEAAAETLASIVVDVLNAASTPSGAGPSGSLAQASLPGELQAPLRNGMTICATAVLDKAALVVVFDGTTTLERVHLKMRRARDRLVKSLPGLGDPTESTPSKS
jgi:predicted regulator of Ras-like GTPase activity (Roadblock/LC7/MglB family)